jgi:hypothetical protein
MIKLKDLLIEKKKIQGYYLMDQLEDLAKDVKRSGEPKAAKALMYLHSKINQSYRDEDLSVDDVFDFFDDPRARKYAKDVPDWMIEDLFEGAKLKEALTNDDIEVGDAYKDATARGFEVSFVYAKERRGGATTIDYQFKPQYGKPFYAGVGVGPPESVDGWGRDKKINVSSKMKKTMIETIETAIKSKYKNSEEVDTLVRNGLRLSDVLSWVKRL